MSGWSHKAMDTSPTRLACGRASRAISRMRSVEKGADRQVVVARPAEPAEVRAAAHHFDEQARPELGVRCEDARAGRVKAIRGLHRGFRHDRRGVRPGLRHDGRNAAGPVVVDVVERRYVKARDFEPAEQHARSRVALPANASTRAGASSSASPAAMTSAKGASGSGLTNVTAPPITTSGSPVAFRRPRLQSRQPQHRHQVGVVPLEGNGKREDVEIARPESATRS